MFTYSLRKGKYLSIPCNTICENIVSQTDKSLLHLELYTLYMYIPKFVNLNYEIPKSFFYIKNMFTYLQHM